jgi:hypothetical protein
MRDELDETPLTAEEQALARKGEALISAAVARAHAPQTLREAIERDRARAATGHPVAGGSWSLRRRLLAAAGAATVVAGGAVAIEAGRDAAPHPTFAKVEAAAHQLATDPAPASLGGTPPTLDARVGAIAFPDWEQSFGWQAVGRRDDTVAGRDVTTVFYRNAKGARLGYAIVAGAPLDAPWRGRRVEHEGKAYHVARAGERTIVAWKQQGHTCVIVASATVPAARLVALAASRNV